MSVLKDLILEAIPSQKYRKSTDLILNGYSAAVLILNLRRT
jgi:hypothetical protein